MSAECRQHRVASESISTANIPATLKFCDIFVGCCVDDGGRKERRDGSMRPSALRESYSSKSRVQRVPTLPRAELLMLYQPYPHSHRDRMTMHKTRLSENGETSTKLQYSGSGCRLLEIMQHNCTLQVSLGKPQVVCLPAPRLFKMCGPFHLSRTHCHLTLTHSSTYIFVCCLSNRCPGRPAVEITRSATLDSESGEWAITSGDLYEFLFFLTTIGNMFLLPGTLNFKPHRAPIYVIRTRRANGRPSPRHRDPMHGVHTP